MQFNLTMTAHDSFLKRLSRSSVAIEAAVADNCRFDERAGGERWQRFAAILARLAADPGAIDWPDWAEANDVNLARHCCVASLAVPDAFLELNRGAWLAGLADNQTVVRCEALNRPLDANGRTLPQLQDLLARADSGKDADAQQAVDRFFETWNQRRDGRPAFAAFYDEVQTEVEAADWPHALRDRLGLGHYGRAAGAPLPVALMRYSLAEALAVRADRKLPVACALPTVLDGGMHEFFFPVPREHPFGATLHLDTDQADTLTAEIIHCRIVYRREHLWKLGVIERPHRVRDGRLREARDLHLLALQEGCERADFGEPMVDRT